MLESVHALSTPSLIAIVTSLRDGVLSGGVSRFGLQPMVGERTNDVATELCGLIAAGMTPSHVATVIEAIATTRVSTPDISTQVALVLSGPDVPGVSTLDTAAVMQSLIAEAKTNILLVGYAVHNGKRIFAPLAERMGDCPQLKVSMCLDISRPHRDTSLPSEIVSRFATDFRSKHWPWPHAPRILYDPRALAESGEVRASLHAKCVVIDRRAALITSANFTEAAQQRNIEAGILIRHAPVVERLAAYFEGLLATSQLAECVL